MNNSEIIDENNQFYMINGVVSPQPIFWEAITKNGERIIPFDTLGNHINCWKDLNFDDLKYFGLCFLKGSAGINLLTNQYEMNNIPIEVGNSEICNEKQCNEIYYVRRHIVEYPNGNRQTWCAEIGNGSKSIIAYFYPEFKIVFEKLKQEL